MLYFLCCKRLSYHVFFLFHCLSIHTFIIFLYIFFIFLNFIELFSIFIFPSEIFYNLSRTKLYLVFCFSKFIFSGYFRKKGVSFLKIRISSCKIVCHFFVFCFSLWKIDMLWFFINVPILNAVYTLIFCYVF